MGQETVCPGCEANSGFQITEKIDEFDIMRCPHCDLEFSHPMRPPGSDWYDSAYIIRHSIIDTSIRDYYKWAILKSPTKGTLLDVGCGEGVFVNYAQQNGFHAFGIDFSQDSIDAGKRLFGLKTTYRCALQEVAEKTGVSQFDVITSFEVLEHLENPKKFLAGLSRLLKKDGALVISVPYRDKWPLREFNDYPPHHLTRWSERSLKSFFSLHGFNVIDVRLGSRFSSFRMFLGYLVRVIIYKSLGMYRKGLTIQEPGTIKENILKKPAVRFVLSRLKPRLIRDILLLPFALLSFPFLFAWFRGNNLMLIAKRADNVSLATCHEHYYTTWKFIDRSLNYGRHHIKNYLTAAGPFHTILDIGAGQGDDLMLARSTDPHADLHAVEVYPVYAARLQEKGIRVHAINIERDKLPFADRSVDVVIANQVLEHVKELFWICHEISRVLPVGGKMILGVPNLASLHNRILLAFGRQPSPLKNNSAHIRGYTKRDMISFMESCFPGGYRLKKFDGSNFYPFPPVIARPLAWLFPNMAWGIFFLFEKQRNYTREFLDYPYREHLETNFYIGQE